MASRDARGQATVEFAFSLIPLTVMFLLLLQVGPVARDQVLVTQAAREGARAAAVDPNPGAAVTAARESTSLDAGRLEVNIGPRPDDRGMVEVITRYRARLVLPLGNKVLVEPHLRSQAAMRVE